MPNLCPIDSQNHEPCAIGQGKGWIGLLQGAGLTAIAQNATAVGIGGLLARTDMGQWIAGSAFATAYYHSDGNGNVTCLMYPNGTLAAKYLYDPFGNMLAQYGSLASANRYRFSSKEWDSNSGLYYYLYRFYDPNLQRWVNRDPLGKKGFDSLSSRAKSSSELTIDRMQAIINAAWSINPILSEEIKTYFMSNEDEMGNNQIFLTINGSVEEFCLNLYVLNGNNCISGLDAFGLYCFQLGKYCEFCIGGKVSGPVKKSLGSPVPSVTEASQAASEEPETTSGSNKIKKGKDKESGFFYLHCCFP